MELWKGIVMKIKPLTWNIFHETHYTDTPFGSYSLWEINGYVYVSRPGQRGGSVAGLNIEDGKSAVETDIISKIKEMLVEEEIPGVAITLTRSQTEHPVPSHGGAAIGVTWELHLNGVLLESQYDRYSWSYNPEENKKKGCNPPSELVWSRDKLIDALKVNDV